MDKALGQKIKQLRLDKKMTLSQLGDKVGLSTGYISLVERGLTSISLTTLQNIAHEFGINSSDLLAYTNGIASANSSIVRGYNLPSFHFNNNYHIYHSLSFLPNKCENSMVPILVTLLPGQVQERVVPYTHEGEDFGYVLEGVLTFTIENTAHQLSPGDSLHLPASIPHVWSNLSNSLVKLVYVNTVKTFPNGPLSK